MTSSVLMRLCNIALKPGISASTKLITTRRICRIVADRLDSITAERRTFRREAGKLKPFLPFTKRAIADIEAASNGTPRSGTHWSESHPYRVWKVVYVRPRWAR